MSTPTLPSTPIPAQKTDPGFMPEVQVDRGAIRFVLGGAHIMCPGLTSPGGRMDEELPAETPVVRGWSCVMAWDCGSGWRADLLPSADQFNSIEPSTGDPRGGEGAGAGHRHHQDVHHRHVRPPWVVCLSCWARS